MPFALHHIDLESFLLRGEGSVLNLSTEPRGIFTGVASATGEGPNAVHQPELELLLLHIKQVEQHIAEQRVRIERLKDLSGPIGIAEDVLATMMKVHEAG